MTDAVETEELDYSYPLGQDPTPLQDRFASWIMSDAVGYAPSAAKTKEEAFREGVRLGVALRIPYQASDHNKEATAAEREERARLKAEEDAVKAQRKAERAAAAAQKPAPQAAAEEQPAQSNKPAKRTTGKAAKPAPAPAAAPAPARPAPRRAPARRPAAAAATSGDAPF
jgi:hypothetical protein